MAALSHPAPALDLFSGLSEFSGWNIPTPLKMELGRGVTPGIPFVVPFSRLWGRLDKWGPPHPPPPEGGGDVGVQLNPLKVYSLLAGDLRTAQFMFAII